MSEIYISFVFIQASLRHKMQLTVTVMHERLYTVSQKKTKHPTHVDNFAKN